MDGAGLVSDDTDDNCTKGEEKRPSGGSEDGMSYDKIVKQCMIRDFSFDGCGCIQSVLRFATGEQAACLEPEGMQRGGAVDAPSRQVWLAR